LRGIGGTMVDEWLTEAGGRGKSIVDTYRAM